MTENSYIRMLAIFSFLLASSGQASEMKLKCRTNGTLLAISDEEKPSADFTKSSQLATKPSSGRNPELIAIEYNRTGPNAKKPLLIICGMKSKTS